MIDHFNFLAPFYDGAFKPPDVERLAACLELPVDGRLLDAGGGTGRVAAKLVPYVSEVVITDISRGMLKQAGAKKGLLASQAESEQLPFSSGSFSRIIVVDALHHFHNQQRALGELLRVLQKGGRMLIQEPDINAWQVKLIALAEKLALMRSRFYSPLAIKEIVQSFGFCAQISKADELSAWITVEK